jgi:hypothetical protein
VGKIAGKFQKRWQIPKTLANSKNAGKFQFSSGSKKI